MRLVMAITHTVLPTLREICQPSWNSLPKII